MKNQHIRAAVITIVSVVASGFIWLLVYSVHYTDSIGFDGPAGGVLAVALFLGWFTSAILALAINRPLTRLNIFDTLLAVLITGAVTNLLCGILLSQYSMTHFPGNAAPF